MTLSLPEDVRRVLDQPVFAHVATLMPDGSPQVSVVWIGVEGDRILFSTAEGRAKTRNLKRDPRVALSITPPNDPYRNITIRGRAVVIEARGTDLIDRMARKYIGAERYPWARPGEIRVDVEIEIDSVSG